MKGKIDENHFFLAFRLVINKPKLLSLSLILGLAVTVAIWPREVVSRPDFILRSVTTFWVMSLVRIYLDRASWLGQLDGFHDRQFPQENHYQATVTTEDCKSNETYVGLTENTFKTRFANHKASFNNPGKRLSTELRKHVWNLKDNNTNFQITYKILKQSIAYKPLSNRCNLCLWEKYFIICKPHLPTHNKRHELVSSCRQTVKFMLQISSPLLLHNRIFGNCVVSIVTAF